METGKCDTIRIHLRCTGFGGKADLGYMAKVTVNAEMAPLRYLEAA